MRRDSWVLNKSLINGNYTGKLQTGHSMTRDKATRKSLLIPWEHCDLWWGVMGVYFKVRKNISSIFQQRFNLNQHWGGCGSNAITIQFWTYNQLLNSLPSQCMFWNNQYTPWVQQLHCSRCIFGGNNKQTNTNVICGDYLSKPCVADGYLFWLWMRTIIIRESVKWHWQYLQGGKMLKVCLGMAGKLK